MTRSFLLFLLLICATVWLVVILYPANKLLLIACDVGQGDAVLAVYGRTQILTDGGVPNGKVMDCLSEYLPFWDRHLELVINTHPQLDHYGGLIEVLKSYKVGALMATSLSSSSQEYQALVNEVGGRGVAVINPKAGEKYRIGLMQLDIIWPTEDFFTRNSSKPEGELGKTHGLGSYTSKNDPNDFSINTILSFGSFDAILTGDIGPKMITHIMKEGKIKDVEYIKVPHHGSKNGLTKELLDASRPEVAVISSGKNNRYGHPHAEVLGILNEKGIRIFRTDLSGNVIIESDGEKFWLKN